MICEKCGAIMRTVKSQFSIKMECLNCGWGWVTTQLDSILEDNTEYEIWLKPGNACTLDSIKLIANITGENFVKAKEILSSDEKILITKVENESASYFSNAQIVQDIAKKLKECGIEFVISPDFPFEA